MTERLSAEQMADALAFARSCTAENEKCLPCRALLQADQDARRYRWLRKHLQEDGDDYDSFLSTRDLFKPEFPKDLDAVIDAAIQKG